MTDNTKTKPGRDGNTLLAEYLRHKDELVGDIDMQELSSPRAPDGSPVPPEWKAFLVAAQATHRTMDALRAAPDGQAEFDAADAAIVAFAAAARAWITVRASIPPST